MFGFGWCLLHALLIHSSIGVFVASKLDFASTTGLPSLDSKTLEVLHANGLHGEVVGRAAEHRRECGIVLLDYTSYTNGLMFDGVLKSFEETLTDNNTLMRRCARSTSQLKFFPGIALIGIGIGIGLGKFVYDGITGLIHRFSEEEQRHKRVMKELIELNKKVQDLAEILDFQTSS
ncbi:unnamed protein product [Strongylus vulgaris]|uniref:Uncharacterized protein n=1 Tax=Strongylus vulgaris TaxID=40348 RepID=A0A3P7J043_STRVU|nr:unnamed protein product [Strongylus vulgaris]